jgi:hypothetical protein
MSQPTRFNREIEEDTTDPSASVARDLYILSTHSVVEERSNAAPPPITLVTGSVADTGVRIRAEETSGCCLRRSSKSKLAASSKLRALG